MALTWNLPLLTTSLYLVGTLLVGALVIALVKRWRGRRTSDELTPSEQLAQFRSLYEQGVISQEEFDRLRALLGGQLRQALQVPPPAVPLKTTIQAALPDGTPPGPTPPEAGEGPTEPPETGIRPA